MISKTFSDLRAARRCALIPYVTAGYPERASTVPLLERLADAGADILEVGIPFSDPLADGPTIQRSSFLALERGTTVRHVLEDVAEFRRRRETPVVLFTYLNPILRYGVSRFLRDAEAAGAQALLVTDLPTGSDPGIEEEILASSLDLVRLVAPTTPLERAAEVARGGSGFLYYISRTGVTGARTGLRDALAEEVRALKRVVGLPVAVGFGISTPEQAAAVASVADGVVVGSAMIQKLDEGGIDGAAAFLRSLREALDEARLPVA